ncbi:MAG TPA: EamA family transporter [Actinobacteria bacterium]|jgi:drug/metabolite transporter (DMT)-like permease|nr:EamA family transporter [Actinomycetota bacterium]
MDRTVREGLVWALVAVLLWSFSLPLTKMAVDGFSAVTVAAGRGVIAGVLATLVLVATRRRPPPRQLWRPLGWTAFGAMLGWPLLLALALQYTTSVHAAVITAVMPLVTAAFAVWFGGEHVTRSFWVAAGLGTATLVLYASARGGLTDGGWLPDLLLIGAVVASSWSYVQGAAASRELSGWEVISWVSALSLPFTVPIAAVAWILTRDAYEPSSGSWTALILLGVSSAYLGFFAWYRGLAMAGTAYGGQVQQLQTLLALVWSAVLLGEVITWGTVVAAGVVVGAVAWAQRSRSGALVGPEE